MGSSQSSQSAAKEQASSGLHLVEIDASKNYGSGGSAQAACNSCSISDIVSFEVGVAIIAAILVLLYIFRKRICCRSPINAPGPVLPYYLPNPIPPTGPAFYESQPAYHASAPPLPLSNQLASASTQQPFSYPKEAHAAAGSRSTSSIVPSRPGM